MVSINHKDNCGNSPRSAFLKAFNIAFAEGNIAYLMDQVDDDISWDIIGDKYVKGKKNFEEALSEMVQSKVKTLNIHHIITHGKTGSVNGEMIMDSGKVYAFCDVCVFAHTGKSAKIKQLTSYCLEVDLL